MLRGAEVFGSALPSSLGDRAEKLYHGLRLSLSPLSLSFDFFLLNSSFFRVIFSFLFLFLFLDL